MRGHPSVRIALILGLVAVVSLAKDMYWQVRLGHQERVHQQTLDRLDSQFETLSQKHERLMTDEDYVEGLIRSTFKHARPGEIVIPLDEDTPEIITVSLTDD